MIEQDGKTVVVESGGQGSNILSAAARADGFAVVPRGSDVVEAGDMVRVEFFRSPETRSHV
jgi:molybdopterin biosynthesis enzyme